MDYEEIYMEYFRKFGEMPPICSDSDYYDPEKIKAIGTAISTGEKL